MMPLVPSPFGTLPQQTIERNAAVLVSLVASETVDDNR